MSCGTGGAGIKASCSLGADDAWGGRFYIRIDGLLLGGNGTDGVGCSAGKGGAMVGKYVCFDEGEGMAYAGEFLSRVDAGISRGGLEEQGWEKQTYWWSSPRATSPSGPLPS
jgi:hypothetical protein